MTSTMESVLRSGAMVPNTLVHTPMAISKEEAFLSGLMEADSRANF